MSAVSLGVAAALVALRCQLISDDPYVLGGVSRVLPSTRPAFLRVLNETRRLVGCPPEGDLTEPPPPFEGGQCLEQYRVTATGLASNGSAGQSIRSGPGPVGGMCFGPENQFGVTPIGVQFANGCVFSGGGGTANTTPARQSTWEIVNIERIDGGADDCGSPPPLYPPPTNFTTNIDITYNIDDGTEITVNAPFVFAPITANFNGTLRIPFTFDLGGFEFSGDINLPDFNVTVNPPSLPPGSGEDLSGEGEDGPGESVDPAPPGEKIIGVVVNATQIDSRRVSSYSSPGITPIFVPRLGSIKFAYSIGIATFFSSDIDIKDRRTFIPCPFSQGADAVIASPNIGVELTFTPIRGFPLATTGDVINPT